MSNNYNTKFPSTFDGLAKLITYLRSEDGCKWDQNRTISDEKKYLLEEYYELVDAVNLKDIKAIKEELGDVMTSMIFYITIISEAYSIDFSSIFSFQIDKLINRHPHVFDNKKELSLKEIESNWHNRKRLEKSSKTHESILGQISTEHPALSLSQLIQNRAAQVGFDWIEIDGVIDKIGEEVKEVNNVSNVSELESELGDLLFALINFIRWKQLDAETVLRKANEKFFKRFVFMENAAKILGKDLSEYSQIEQEEFWNQSKSEIK